MRSPVNWALLGLVIQRPSYGYELVQRFERTFGNALELSSPSQIYTALDTLARRALIEAMPLEELGDAAGRQPKPHYRATAQGARDYEQWLLCQMRQERRRARMLAQQLAMLAPSAALRVLERCEQTFLKEASVATRGDRRKSEPGEQEGLTARLIAEEERLAIGARLGWIDYARRELNALLSGRTQRR
jgi:DNA-binding PadR family transcriptional regulator